MIKSKSTKKVLDTACHFELSDEPRSPIRSVWVHPTLDGAVQWANFSLVGTLYPASHDRKFIIPQRALVGRLFSDYESGGSGAEMLRQLSARSRQLFFSATKCTISPTMKRIDPIADKLTKPPRRIVSFFWRQTVVPNG